MHGAPLRRAQLNFSHEPYSHQCRNLRGEIQTIVSVPDRKLGQKSLFQP